jgi:hypothetical protein
LVETLSLMMDSCFITLADEYHRCI